MQAFKVLKMKKGFACAKAMSLYNLFEGSAFWLYLDPQGLYPCPFGACVNICFAYSSELTVGAITSTLLPFLSSSLIEEGLSEKCSKRS